MKIDREWIQKRIDAVNDGILPIPDNLDKATQALFWEYRSQTRSEERGITPVYNLSKRDHDDTLSMYQIYMQCSSEYEAAIVLLGDYAHWEHLCTRPWFSQRRDAWERERSVRDYANGITGLRKAAEAGNASAAEKLMNLSKPKAPVGRPSPKRREEEGKFKDDVDRYLEQQAAEAASGTIQ